MLRFFFIVLVVALAAWLWRGYSQPPLSAPLAWTVPRTIRLTNGQTFANATIRSLSKDGGVIINYNRNAIKIYGNLLDADTLKEITEAAPEKPLQSPTPKHTILDLRQPRPH